MPDSIPHIADSVSLLSDSVLVRDSLIKADSLAHADSLRLILAQPTGMEGVANPSLPSTEPWFFIVIAVLFLLLVSGIIKSAGALLQNFKSFFSRKDSVILIVNPTANFAQFQLFITVFTICVFALTTSVLVFRQPDKFQFIDFIVFCGVFTGYYILKHFLFEITGNTFFGPKVTKNYKIVYFSLMHVAAILIFPLMILYAFQPISWQQPLTTAIVVVVAIFYIVLIIKLFQIFYVKPLALFYIFLYLCTLEILPVLILFRVIEKIT